MSEPGDELSLVADALAEGERTMRTPRRVVDALLPPPAEALGLGLGPLTMEGWLQLLEADSAYLEGPRPESAEAEVRQFAYAVEVLTGASREEVQVRLMACDETEVLRSMGSVELRIAAAFATQLPMTPPPSSTKKRSRPSNDGGLGLWALTFAALVQDLGMSRAEARQTPVGEAGVLLAASKFREGWDVKGQNWREQEILGEVPDDE